ncbi:hypothetical protein [Streptomyces sp. NPDC054952]
MGIRLTLDLPTWMPMLALTGDVLPLGPKRLRQFSATWLVTTGRHRRLRLARRRPWTEVSTTTFERPEPCRTLADQRQRACLNENRKPERWNPAPTRRDGRAITLSITNRRSRNGPPDEPTDRHKGDRSQARHQ